MDNSIINLVFGKALGEITKENLENYFLSPQRESDKIEYKSYTDFDASSNQKVPDQKKNGKDKAILSDIMETIVAFLNSDGGFLIWGAPTETAIKGEKGTFTKVP